MAPHKLFGTGAGTTVERDRPDGVHLSDEVLVELVIRRDIDAFSTLYDRFAPAVHGMAAYMLGRSEAEEVVQEVFLRLWDKADQFNGERGPFRPWFMTIARNHILTQLRLRGHDRQVAITYDIEKALAQQPDPTADIEEAAAGRERQGEMLRALRQLPEEQRIVLIMAYFGGLSQSGISRELNLPLGTVKKRTRLGLRKLRALLDKGIESSVHES